MTLEEKGRIIPPPVLSRFPQKVSAAVQSWEEIISATHWDLYKRDRPDGADFYVGEEELGHIHLDGSVHLATSKEIGKALLKEGLAEPFPWGGENAGWVLYNIINEKTATFALWLFRLNYRRIKGIPVSVLLTEIKEMSGTLNKNKD